MHRSHHTKKSDFIQYRELGQLHKAEITDGKYLMIEHFGTIIGHGTPFIIGTPKSGKLHSFEMVLAKNWEEVPRAIIAMLNDYTLWHRRMGHAHQPVIKHLRKKH